jgi:uncharacterized membrane protein
VLFLRAEAKDGVWREAMLTLFALLFLAGIGLVGQVYNLSGAWWSAIALWCGLALPAALYAHSRLLPSLWSLAVVVVPLIWIAEARLPAIEVSMLFGLLAITMLLTAASFLGQLSGKLREEFRSALIVFGVGCLLMVATPWVNAIWGNGYYLRNQSVPLGAIGIAWLATGIAIVVSLLRASEPRNLRVITALLLLLVATYVSIPHLIDTRQVFPGSLNQVVAAVGFLFVWGTAAASAAMASRNRLFDLATVVIALRFIVIYFEVFGSLTTTGIGLIVSGLVIIGIGVAWNRGRKRIKGLVEART